MIGAGTVINPIIKVVTTVAILAAVGIFIVKPILDTTEDISADVSRQAREVSAGVNENVREAQEASDRAFSDAQLQAVRSTIASYLSSLGSSWPAAARELRSCTREAGTDPIALVRCKEFGQRVVHGVQSDRSFATSYATSLAAQGDGAAAQRIEDCVKEAGFATAPMERCRNLADELLFG